MGEIKIWQPKSPEEEFLKSLNLSKGKKVKFIKVKRLTESDVPVGSTFEGVLDQDVKMGQPIYVINNNVKKTISNITGAAPNEGKIYLKTSTSIYELILDKPLNKQQEKVISVTSADLEKEMNIFYSKKYDQYAMMNYKVPLKDNPYHLVLTNKGFKAGDEIIFYAERERKGNLELNHRGELVIKDKDGNPYWGIGGILMTKGNYIKKV